MKNLFINVILCRSIERKITWQHYVKQHPNTPNITFVYVLTLEYFRCNIVRSPYYFAHFRRFCKVSLRQSKIYELDSAIFSHHDILSFYISMDNVCLMAMIDSFKQIIHYVCNYWFLQSLSLRLLCDEVKEIPTWAILHNNVQKLVILICLIILNDIRMIKCLDDLNLRKNRFELGRNFLFSNCFDRDLEIWVSYALG